MSSLDLWKSLDKIQEAIGVPDRIFAEMLDLPVHQLPKLRERRKSPPLNCIVGLSEALRIPVEGIFHDSLDYFALTRSFRGTPALPRKYQSHAFSRRRTSVNILAYLDVNYGIEFRKTMLKLLQVPEILFTDPDAPISIRFLEDLTALLREFGLGDDCFVHMGFMSHATNLATPLGRSLSRHASLRDLHDELFNQLIGSFEMNHDYRIQTLTSERIIVDSTQREEVLDALGKNRFGNYSTCLARLGVTMAMPAYLGLPFSAGKHTRCVHHGDAQCRFEIDFPSRVKPLSC